MFFSAGQRARRSETAALKTDMALFFSGAVTSSPIRRRRRRRATQSCQSLDTSLLSPDSSYVCYSPASGAGGGGPCSCRRSARLLTNGYYSVTEDSFSWDEDGNVSLSPCTTSVSYKENLVRVFRRRRRPRGTLASLLSDVTDSCQSWLDQKVFRGMFGTGHNRDRDQDLDLDLNWEPRSSKRAPLLEETSWSPIKTTEVEETRDFTFDHTEIPHPSDKVAPPPEVLMQEEICSETCQSEEPFTQSVGGLSEVPPLPAFYSGGCSCQAPPERPGATVKALLLLLLLVTFVLTALLSWCHTWTTAVASTAFVTVISYLLTAKLSRSVGGWRAAKTEDITSRNE